MGDSVQGANQPKNTQKAKTSFRDDVKAFSEKAKEKAKDFQASPWWEEKAYRFVKDGIHYAVKIPQPLTGKTFKTYQMVEVDNNGSYVNWLTNVKLAKATVSCNKFVDEEDAFVSDNGKIYSKVKDPQQKSGLRVVESVRGGVEYGFEGLYRGKMEMSPMCRAEMKVDLDAATEKENLEVRKQSQSASNKAGDKGSAIPSEQTTPERTPGIFDFLVDTAVKTTDALRKHQQDVDKARGDSN